MSFEDETKEETRYIKKWIIWIVVVALVVSGIVWFANRAERTVDAGFIRYEEFQEIYNTCEKLNTDLCNMRDMPDDDKSFEQFTKAQRLNTLKTQLNKWVQDYNAKSKMWNRSMWKSSSLPYQLDVSQFKCYTN
ncbi:MAG: hypothetical protein WCJ39_08315 [bacterium]